MFDAPRSHVSNAAWMYRRVFEDCDNATSLLSLGRAFSSTDPRDKVYALLGFPAASSLEIKPDYERDIQSLYRDVATKIITKSKDLRILSCVHHSSDVTNKTISWVPQWDIDEFVPRFGFYPWSASGTKKMAGECDDETLKLQGKDVDEIDLVWQWCEGWQEMIFCSPQSFSGDLPNVNQDTTEQQQVQIVHAITGGLDADQNIASLNHGTYGDDFKAWILYLDNVKNTTSFRPRRNIDQGHIWARGGDHERFSFAAETWCKDHILYRTKNGSYGLGPLFVKEGDLVVVIFGCPVPLVLRKDASQDSKNHRLIGETYMHGVMAGEALSTGSSRQYSIV